ncbi:MAG: prolipoprotein diacylglyceryl transferase [Flavobacteriales bacterium]|nr:prolipoprotein diacylglyceryl transferase [Flavobacteriales bacterium]
MAEKEVAKGTGWLNRLGAHWGVSAGRAVIILTVFASTGFTVMFLKRPVVAFFTQEEGGTPMLFSILYYILILPFYNVILLIYGALLGQFAFFWAFEKRFFNRIFGRKK